MQAAICNTVVPTESKRPITTALRMLLTPIVKILIELGFSFRDFNEVAKLVYVDVASENYGLKGRRTNMSRIAIMTGLTRREVARLRKVIDHDPVDVNTPTTVAGKVLANWHKNPSYLNATDAPKRLPIEGAGSLTEMINGIGGDVPPTAVIKELERVNAISVVGKTASVKSHQYMRSRIAPPSIERFGSVLRDLGATISHNLLDPEQDNTLFEARVSNDQINIADYEAFRDYLQGRAQAFLKEIDSWLNEHQVTDNTSPCVRLGIGLYTIANEALVGAGSRFRPPRPSNKYC